MTAEEGFPAPVRVHQRTAEFAALLDIYKQRQPRRVLEIGTYEGGTLYHWLQGQPDVVVSVDDFSMEIDNRALYPEWVPQGTTLKVVAGRSDAKPTVNAVKRLAPFDWAFIDADHSYEGVRSDWERYRPLCDGVMAFHDILPPSDEHPEIQVSRLWGEIKAAGWPTVELIADPHAAWGGIGIVLLDERNKRASRESHR